MVLDWFLVGLSGRELCHLIKRNHQTSQTYVIGCMPKQSQHFALEAVLSGVDDILTSPFDEYELAARIKLAETRLARLAHQSEVEQLLFYCKSCQKIQGADGIWRPAPVGGSWNSSNYKVQTCPGCIKQVVLAETGPVPAVQATG